MFRTFTRTQVCFILSSVTFIFMGCVFFGPRIYIIHSEIDTLWQHFHESPADGFVKFHQSDGGPRPTFKNLPELNKSLNYAVHQQRQMAKLDILKSEKDYKSTFYMLDIEEEIRNSILGSPLEPLSNFRNPCWLSRLTGPDPYSEDVYYPKTTDARRKAGMLSLFQDKIKQGYPWHMRCVPSVFLCGIAKSGSSDLGTSIFMHPEVTSSGMEFKYWNRLRLWKPAYESWENFNKKGRASFREYVDQFDPAGEAIQSSYVTMGDTEIHHKITMDKTPHYLFDYDGWEKIPGNKGLEEPRYMLAHTLRKLLPKAKFVVILREPTERLYSHFRMYSPKEPASLFHKMTLETVRHWAECVSTHTVRACAYNRSLNPYEFSHPGGFVLRASMYSVFLNDWLKVFPRDQFYVVFGDDYYKNRTVVLQSLFRFLGLKQLSGEEFRSIENKKISNSKDNKSNTSSEPMMEETRHILEEFFKPFNKQLAALLNDDRFLWKK